MRFLTAGESHGPGLVGILEGLPAGLPLDRDAFDIDLARRQKGYGRGGRMAIEQDRVEVLSGLRFGETLGSPLAILIRNKDFANWEERMSPFGTPSGRAVTRPRPGHADLAGALKYGRDDVRDILERASARETAMRVALGGPAKRLLEHFNVHTVSHVVQLGPVEAAPTKALEDWHLLYETAEASPVRTLDPHAEAAMIDAIDRAREAGDSLGGIFEVRVFGLPVGLGSHVQWDRKLDGRLAQALMSIPAMKGVELGAAFVQSGHRGSQVHDEIFYSKEQGIYRESNRAGGTEGGITNGEALVVRVAMKPLSTLKRPLRSIDLRRLEPENAGVERTDVTAVPAAGVIGEAMVALTLADAFMEKFGGDSLPEMDRNYAGYVASLRR